MRCDRCATPSDPEDNFCRHCGSDLRPIDVPAVSHGPSYPAPIPVWRQAAPVVAQGAAMVAAGAILNLAGRRLARAALRIPMRMLTRGNRNGSASALEPLSKGTEAFTEMLYVRQIRSRR